MHRKKLINIILYIVIYGLFVYGCVLIGLWITDGSFSSAYHKMPIISLPLYFLGGLIYLLISQWLFGKDSPDGKIL